MFSILLETEIESAVLDDNESVSVTMISNDHNRITFATPPFLVFGFVFVRFLLSELEATRKQTLRRPGRTRACEILP